MAHKLGPLTVVEWQDSTSIVGSTWNNLDEIAKGKPHICKSVGWLAAEDKGSLTLVAHLSGDDGGGDMCIPKPSIVKRRVVR